MPDGYEPLRPRWWTYRSWRWEDRALAFLLKVLLLATVITLDVFILLAIRKALLG